MPRFDPGAPYAVAIEETTYPGGDGVRQPASVFFPQGEGPFAIAVHVHGGAWNGGERLRAQLVDEELAACGLIVAAIDFRLAPAHPYPAQVEDTVAAIGWLREQAGRWNGDGARLGLIGDSSGGHTALLPAMQTGWNAGPIDWVIALWPVLDPHARYLYAVRNGYQRLARSTEAYFLTEEAMREANPQGLLDRGELVSLPPVQVIQGDTDANIPNAIPLAFEIAYRNAGGLIELEWFAGQPHSFAINPGSHTAHAVVLMRNFVARQVG
ncbi:MAG: alpha/beta hydrolase [Chloroflexota bacterium]